MRLFKHRLFLAEDGYTLVELIISLALIALIAVLCLNTAAFSAMIAKNTQRDFHHDLTRRRIVTHLQKQIEMSNTIRIRGNTVYLQDMESKGYYNYYTLSDGVLKRHKTSSDLSSIGSGSTSQLAEGLSGFKLKAEIVNNQPTGKITLTIQFKNKNNDESYSFLYPGNNQKITIQ